MTPAPDLDAAIRQARHLLFALDGPIPSMSKANLVESITPTDPTSAHIYEALTACRESGRSVAVISASTLTEVSTVGGEPRRYHPEM